MKTRKATFALLLSMVVSICVPLSAADPKLLPTKTALTLENLKGHKIAAQKIPAAVLSGAVPSDTVGAGRTAALAWKSAFTQGNETAWSLTLTNLTDQRTGVTVRMSLILPGADYAPLFASWEDTPDWPADGRLVYAYHHPFPGVEWNDYIKLVIPFASFADDDADTVLSFCTDLTFPVLPMRIYARQEKHSTHVEIERPLVRLEPNATVTLVHYIAPHDGDVRSGLRWLRDTFRHKFFVPESALDIQTELTGVPYVLTEHYKREALSERPSPLG